MENTELYEILRRRQGRQPAALKVHLALDMRDCGRWGRELLRRYGKVEKSITRDVIVPADFPLRALHHVIQKLFGWEDSHLHHFAFPEDVFAEVTKNSAAQWCRLAGVYFLFPRDEPCVPAWDGGICLEAAPRNDYYYAGLDEQYLENQLYVRELKRQVPILQIMPSFTEILTKNGNVELKSVPLGKATMEEFRGSIAFGGGLNQLLERLCLLDCLRLPRSKQTPDTLEEKLALVENGLDGKLKRWEAAAEAAEDHADALCALARSTTILREPQSSRIEYFYDYGDDWKVSIRIEKAFYEGDGKDDPAVRTVLDRQRPVCVAADGLPVMDDVGGIYGYLEFLERLYGGTDADKRAEARDWAREMGWTGRMKKPQNML